MKPQRAVLFGIVGAIVMSLLSVLLRAAGVPIQMEMILGTLTGIPPGPTAFVVGELLHVGIGALFGLIYGALFEKVWNHGGAGTGMILSVLHACLIGILFGLVARVHPYVPRELRDPGAYFSNLGIAGVLSFFALHILYGAIVGAGYGHVASEHDWAPEGRL